MKKLIFISCLVLLIACTSESNKESVLPDVIESKVVTQNIFGVDVTFDYSDFEDLESNPAYEKYTIGSLTVPTGRLVCVDPMLCEMDYPQTWQVEPGSYTVNIYIALEGEFKGRVAYAELVLSEDVCDAWELSLIDEHMLADEFEKEMNGLYPVESGLSAFCDYETWLSYEDKMAKFYEMSPKGNFYTEVLDSLFKENSNIPLSSRGEDWANYEFFENSNIIMFGTGYGDGVYPRYVGYDKNKQPVKFITDFIQINEQD